MAHFWEHHNIAVFQSLSRAQLFATPCAAACQASLSFNVSQSLLKLMSIESVMPSNHLILCRPLLLLPSIFPSIRVFSNESALRKILELQHQSLKWIFRVDFLQDWLVWSPWSPRDFARVFSSTIIQKHQLIPIVSKAMFSESGQQKGKSKCPWPSPRWDQRCPNKMAMSRLILPSPLFSFFQFANIEFRASDNVLYLRES